jgi:N6-adenosine-specific RNA methylase IME4
MTSEQGANRARYLFPAELQPPVRPFAPLPTTDGGWACVEADPAWNFRQWSDPETEEQKRISKAAERHYPTMSVEEIMALPVKDVVAKDAHLWLWITGPFLVAGTHVDVMRSWGFEPSATGFVWIKLQKRRDAYQHQLMTIEEMIHYLHTGTGKTTRKNAEFCLLGRRGKPQRLAADVHEVIISARREHSRKPVESFERIERYCPGPRLQMFSRQPRAGWTTWGNETEKFA